MIPNILAGLSTAVGLFLVTTGDERGRSDDGLFLLITGDDRGTGSSGGCTATADCIVTSTAPVMGRQFHVIMCKAIHVSV